MFSQLFSKAVDRITPDEALHLMEKDKNTVLLDVRTPEEYKSIRIPGSVNIPLDQIGRFQEQFPEKDKPVIVYCLSGARASSAVRLLKAKGYTNVSNLGGINTWPYNTNTDRNKSGLM